VSIWIKPWGSLFRGVEGADRDEVFKEFSRFGEAFALQGGGGPAGIDFFTFSMRQYAPLQERAY
jgi:hypothetical protein